MRNFKQIGHLIYLFIFSITAMAGNNVGNENIRSNDTDLDTNSPVLAQILSSDLSSSVNITAYTATTGDTVLADSAKDENLYGFKAMEYSDEKYSYNLPCRLYIPENYQEGEKYPLVIFLHGAGRRGSDNISQIKNMEGPLAFVNPEVQNKYPSIVLAPQCPENDNWSGVSSSGERFPKSLEDIRPSSAYLMLMELLEILQNKYGIDSNRIYLTGQSMGGVGTWFIALSNPDKFAAIAPICGWSLPSEAAAIADMPVWAFHGAEDKTIPPDGSRNMVKALKEAGNKKVKYTEYPNVGHESWKEAYTEDTDNNGEVDLIEWMFSQKRN